jgi:hypothetical protein
VAHQIEIDVGLDCKTAQRLIQHLPVLRRDAAERVEDILARAKCLVNRRHLDRFGSRPEDEHDPLFPLHPVRPSHVEGTSATKGDRDASRVTTHSPRQTRLVAN